MDRRPIPAIELNFDRVLFQALCIVFELLFGIPFISLNI